jgi:polyhydroxyalkanoate synthesis regulator phasin
MAQSDILRRYLDSGLAFTAMTQTRAEALVKDLVKAGEVQADQARDMVADLVDRSRKNSEKLLETVRREVKDQITNLGLVSKADLDKAEERLSALLEAATGPVRKAADRMSPGNQETSAAPAPTAPEKATPARKATPGKTATPAKRATATKKTSAKKATGSTPRTRG